MAPGSQRELVWLSAVTWDFPLVGRTRMLAEEWSALGQPTTFVQIPSYRTALERVAKGPGSRAATRVVRPWPSYPSALWSSMPEERLRGGIRRRARSLRRRLESHFDLESAVALVVSPVWTPWLEELPFRAVVYDCIDNLEVMIPRPGLRPLYRRWEDELIERASAVVTSSSGLAAQVGRKRAEVPLTTIQNGVRVDEFLSIADGPRSPAAVTWDSDLPVVGFAGALYDWIDWSLIEQVAGELTEFRFVFVGPTLRAGVPQSVSRLPNICFPGPRPYREIPHCVSSFDICWVPFRQCGVSAEANPVKLYEYLALGKPVVTTPVADLDTFRGFVEVGKGAAEIIGLLRGVSESTRVTSSKRVEFALENTWGIRAKQYLEFLEVAVS